LLLFDNFFSNICSSTSMENDKIDWESIDVVYCKVKDYFGYSNIF
jgi:hypothetical protein